VRTYGSVGAVGGNTHGHLARRIDLPGRFHDPINPGLQLSDNLLATLIHTARGREMGNGRQDLVQRRWIEVEYCRGGGDESRTASTSLSANRS